MEVKVQRPAYYFSWPDEEILDEKFLEIPGDDETWLYRVERGGYNGHFQTPTQPNYYHTPSGSVDSRTFTRRKHTLRPSLESVAESHLSNRSSLGILSASRLNDTKLMETPISTNQGRTSLSFTASDKPHIPRVFKLDSPITNYLFERKRHDSELSDSSIIPSLDSQFDKNEAMTDSLVNFLEKPNGRCQPPAGFQDEKPMYDSIVSLSEKESGLEFNGEAMTDSMVNFLEPVTCKPPSGFGDEDMVSSIVNLDDKDILPASDMTNSLMDYLECGKTKTATLTLSTASYEAENIPPENSNNTKEELNIKNERDCTLNVEYDSKKSPDITFTNNINSSRTRKEIINIEEDRCFTRPINTTFEKENESNLKSRALNNRDLNVARDLNDEDTKEFNMSKLKIPCKTNTTTTMSGSRLDGMYTNNVDCSRMNGSIKKSYPSSLLNNTRLNETFTVNEENSSCMNRTSTKSNLNNMSRQMPPKNSSFNTTYTKDPPKDVSRRSVTRSTEGLDAGVEDDRTSSASDSSFSSAASSSKPRSVDELRTIAQQQETNLVQSSTPTEATIATRSLAQLDLELSPIRRMSLEGRKVTESRSAHSSPVRSPLPSSPRPHPISRLQQPIIEARRQTLQASSLSNLAMPRMSRLRMPQPSGRVSMLLRPVHRPTTAPTPVPTPAPAPAPAPTPAPTAIPRPQGSRLPMPRLRASGIPTMKRGGRH